MSAFYFGPADRQLYGYFHDAGYTATRAALICAPWGTEYQNTHRTLRVLARSLAERGCHVLRFDYSGTGDSWGETTDADLDQWQSDVRAALRELRTLSGSDVVSVFGMRIGGHVAATAVAGLAGVDQLMLWDPVFDGTAWAAEFAYSHHERPIGDDAVEFGRVPISKRFHQQIRNLTPVDFDALARAGAFVLTTTESPASVDRARLAAAGITAEFVPDMSPWVGDIAIDHGQLPTRALRRVLEWYDGG